MLSRMRENKKKGLDAANATFLLAEFNKLGTLNGTRQQCSFRTDN